MVLECRQRRVKLFIPSMFISAKPKHKCRFNKMWKNGVKSKEVAFSNWSVIGKDRPQQIVPKYLDVNSFHANSFNVITFFLLLGVVFLLKSKD